MTVYQRHKAMNVRDFRALVFRHHDGKFRELTNANVLIYWPHGFGDWVFFSYIVPLLEPTNRYWMTRFGDDTVSIMDGNEWVMPIYGGTNSTHCDDGGAFQNRHFGLDFDEIDGNEKPVSLPVSIYEACVQNKIDSVLFTDFPEPFGYSPFPFHSKPRNILRSLVRRKALEHVSLGRPLQSTINFSVPEWLTLWTESRLRNFCGFGQRKMCMIGRNGFTAIGKNWGHRWREEMPAGKRREGEECRDFMRLWLKKDPNWCFLILEERMFEGDNTVRDKELHAFSYAEIFGTVDASTIPFGLVMKTLANLADLAIGVPAGPFHLCMAKNDLPTVGLWTEHFPSWYDEPKTNAIHLLSRNIKDIDLLSRPGSFEKKENLQYRTVWSENRVLLPDQVMSLAEELLH